MVVVAVCDVAVFGFEVANVDVVVEVVINIVFVVVMGLLDLVLNISTVNFELGFFAVVVLSLTVVELVVIDVMIEADAVG